MESVPKVEYLPCEKSGYHFGQVLNMICLDPGCQSNMLCCCACIEQSHKDHNTKPLRLVLLQASNNSKYLKPTLFNIDITVDIINSNLKASVESIRNYKEDILQNIENIENNIIEYHSNLIDQIQIKNVDPKVEIAKSFKIVQNANPEPKEYIRTIKRLTQLLIINKQEKTLSENDIVGSLKAVTDELSDKLKKKMNETTQKIKQLRIYLEESKKISNIWKNSSFKFIPEFKHPDINIISDLIVKSSNSSGYKFAVMEPSLEDGQPIKQMAFKIKQSHSNWVAVGMCHKQTVKAKNFGFNFSSIGHGAYMVSANGAIWNSTRSDQNNSIKGFDFKKDDIIHMKVNFAAKTVTFKKKDKQHTLTFTTIAGDDLCPCVLFYYMNDEVEVLPKFKL